MPYITVESRALSDEQKELLTLSGQFGMTVTINSSNNILKEWIDYVIIFLMWVYGDDCTCFRFKK